MKEEHLAIASVPRQKWGPIYAAPKALKTGTIFEELDMPFFAADIVSENQPEKIPDEREQMMQSIYENGFVMTDLMLYLDMHPEDMDAQDLLKTTLHERNALKKEFAEKYYPLLADCMAEDAGMSYSWTEGPVPWEGACI